MSGLAPFHSAGFRVTALLGSGTEGSVAELDSERVVKLWDHGRRQDVDRLRAFYDAVHSGLAIAVPRILEVVEVEDRLFTVHVRLSGGPPTGSEIECVVAVLDALAAVPVGPKLAVLPVPQVEEPFSSTVSFPSQLADLVRRRALVLGDHVRPATTQALISELRALSPVAPRLIHGDLGPPNLLVTDGRPTGLLDFGYLSTVGDPAFDAAVAVVLGDMFGPDAAGTRARLRHLVIERFGYSEHRLAVYQAAYGLVTASLLVDFADSRHFRWCLDLLRR